MKSTHIAIGALAILAAGLFAQEVASLFGRHSTSVACSADGKTVYLIISKSIDCNSGRLYVSNDGGATWRLIQP